MCCAIFDKKHQLGVSVKKNWLKEKIAERYVFRKLDKKGKSGICVLGPKKKSRFWQIRILLKYGFETVDTVKNE